MSDRAVEVSVVIPVHDERGNVGALVAEVVAALDPLGVAYEIVVVDDGSADGSHDAAVDLLATVAALRVVRLLGANAGTPLGISAALHAGLRAARGPVIVTIDGDRQNDPAEIPRLLSLLERERADLVIGDRTATRRDGPVRRASSAVGRLARRALLGDRVRDTGCGLRVMPRTVALELPLHLRGMHRFIPILVRRAGGRVVETPISHRQRTWGTAKHGVLDRAWPALVDCLAVRWMLSRRRAVGWEEVRGDGRDPPPPGEEGGRRSAD